MNMIKNHYFSRKIARLTTTPPLPHAPLVSVPKIPVCRFRTLPCVHSKCTRVYRHHAHMLKHMCAWCRHTRGRIECTHGGCIQRVTPHHTATHHNTTHHNTTSSPHGDGERQRKKTKEDKTRRKRGRQDKTRRIEERRREKRQDERDEREDERQDERR